MSKIRVAIAGGGNCASALAAAEAIGDEPFLLTMCNHIYDQALPMRLTRAAPAPGRMQIAVDYDKSMLLDPADVTKVKVENADIGAIDKTLADWDCSDTGVMYCTDGLFDGLRAAALDGQHSLTAGLAKLAAEGRAHTVDVTGCWWLDVDTTEARLFAEQHLAERMREIG